MSIAGNLKTMQLAELLQWLSQSLKTGTLVIETEKIEKRIFFREGRIVSSSSTDPSEYLGQFLIGHGFLTEEQLDAVIKKQNEQKALLGKILVDQGAITEDDLHQLLRLKAEETIYDIFTWPEGEFRFLDGALPEFTMVSMRLDVTGIMMEGARRLDEWRRIREVIPSKHAVPVSVVEDLVDADADQVTQSILELIDDDRTVEEIQQAAHCSEFQVCCVLFEEVKEKRIKVVRARVIEKQVTVEKQAAPQQAPPQQPPAPAYGHLPGQPQQPPQAWQQPAPPPPQPAYTPPGQPQPTMAYATAGPPPPQAAPPPQAQASSGSGPITSALSMDQLDPDSLLKAASESLAKQDPERALRYLRSARSVDPDNENLARAIKNAEGQIRDLIDRSGVRPKAVPKLAIPMEKLMSADVSAQEGFVLTRVDGSYDIKSIIQISAMSELDGLVLFWRMREAGHITL